MPLNAIYRDPIIRPLNNANAFMAAGSTAMTERQRLVHDRSLLPHCKSSNNTDDTTPATTASNTN